MSKKRILIVDDESLMRDFLGETLRRMKHEVDQAENGKIGISKIANSPYDLVITDLRMPDVTGIDVLKAVKQHQTEAEVIIITAFGTIENAVEAMKIGAYDYIQKPFNADEIELLIKKVFEYQKLKEDNKMLRNEVEGKYKFDSIIGKSANMQSIFETIQTVADSSATVFIQGPSGTGKELIAKAIHFNSSRRNMPFIKTNCAALPEGLMESELFGHEKGAFTGAVKTRKGRFEAADNGTLLLDEISEISPNLQAKMLRVLQEKEFEKVGDLDTIKVDVRIIATTNRDIKEEIKNGNFREDLYYRLNVIPIHLPPLKERKKDIPMLVEHFVQKFNNEHNRQISVVSDEALNLLMQLDYPGNVRELENRIERAVLLSAENELTPKHFLFEDDSFDKVAEISSLDTDITIREMEKQLILKTLRSNENNRTKTADILGISVRTLRNKLNEYKENNELDPYFIKGGE